MISSLCSQHITIAIIIIIIITKARTWVILSYQRRCWDTKQMVTSGECKHCSCQFRQICGSSVQRSTVICGCSAFIEWTGWTLAVVVFCILCRHVSSWTWRQKFPRRKRTYPLVMMMVMMMEVLKAASLMMTLSSRRPLLHKVFISHLQALATQWFFGYL